MKRALITGITGQDGSYLAELLLEKGYEVHGLIRRTSSSHYPRISHIEDRLKLHHGDLSDSLSLQNVIEKSNPDEVYNLAAMSQIQASFEMPEYTVDVNGTGVLRLLQILRKSNPKVRFYQASTADMFSKSEGKSLSEKAPFHPRSPYAISKLLAYWTVVNFRESHGLFACNGLLFNHESPRRGEMFVTRKISLAVAKIKAGLQEKVTLGNLDAKVDWGYAKDFVEGIWLMLQQKKPADYVLASGKTATVRYFVEQAFLQADLSIFWEGDGLEEKGIDKNGNIRVEISPQFYRASPPAPLIADCKKANTLLGWKPKTSIEELVKIMVESDVAFIEKTTTKDLLLSGN